MWWTASKTKQGNQGTNVNMKANGASTKIQNAYQAISQEYKLHRDIDLK